MALPGTGQAVRGYPALVDEGDAVGVRVLETPAAQREAMRQGTRKLLALGVPSPIRHVQGQLTNAARLSSRGRAARRGPRDGARGRDSSRRSTPSPTEAGGPAWDAAGFARLRAHVAGGLAVAHRGGRGVTSVRILDAAREVERALVDAVGGGAALAPARVDVQRQLGRLVYPGFVTLHRRGPAARRRALPARGGAPPGAAAERAGARPRQDARRPRSSRPSTRALLEAWPPGRPVPAALRDVPWLLEELRVSHFAQALGTRGQVFSKRIRKLLADAR